MTEDAPSLSPSSSLSTANRTRTFFPEELGVAADLRAPGGGDEFADQDARGA